MKWKEIVLANSEEITFGDRAEISIFYRVAGVPDKKPGTAIIRSSQGKEVTLADVVDNGQTVSAPRVFAIFARSERKVLLFGGPTSYVLTRDLHIENTLSLYRKREDEEYWSSEIVDLQNAIVIVYESGVLLLNDDLQVKWHRQKYFNDFFDSIHQGSLRFLRDGEKGWLLSIDSGEIRYSDYPTWFHSLASKHKLGPDYRSSSNSPRSMTHALDGNPLTPYGTSIPAGVSGKAAVRGITHFPLEP